jgi:DNA modification methylase
MRWLIHALTKPGETVASPFCGTAPCGIAAVQLGRKYHGIETNRRYRKIAEARIAAYGKENGT